jgi:hypothetical protein
MPLLRILPRKSSIILPAMGFPMAFSIKLFKGNFRFCPILSADIALRTF